MGRRFRTLVSVCAPLTLGISVWVDWLSPKAQDYWTGEMRSFYESVPFDGVWVDLNEVASGCAFSCGNVLLNSTDVVSSYLQSTSTAADPRKINFPLYKINKYVLAHNIYIREGERVADSLSKARSQQSRSSMTPSH